MLPFQEFVILGFQLKYREINCNGMNLILGERFSLNPSKSLTHWQHNKSSVGTACWAMQIVRGTNCS